MNCTACNVHDMQQKLCSWVQQPCPAPSPRVQVLMQQGSMANMSAVQARSLRDIQLQRKSFLTPSHGANLSVHNNAVYTV